MDYNPLSPEVIDNPYPHYAYLHEHAPAYWIEPPLLPGRAIGTFGRTDCPRLAIVRLSVVYLYQEKSIADCVDRRSWRTNTIVTV